MNDKELLELAAKAAGETFEETWHGCNWNPLENDGDAFRLAVKLEMTIDFCEGKIWHNRIEIDFGGGGDQNEHARRAIVRAAAEIGRGVK